MDCAQLRFSAILLALILALPVSAYEYPLSREAVRQAYFFGRSTERARVAEFLGRYMRRFQPRNEGPYVGAIELRTPYEQVVLRAWENQTGYSAQQAQIDYAAQSDMVSVRVFLFFAHRDPHSADLYVDEQGRVRDRYENFWREFKFRVVQGHVIGPKRLEDKPLYSPRGRGLGGAEVLLQIDASDLQPQTIRIEVVAPDGEIRAANFALDQLK